MESSKSGRGSATMNKTKSSTLLGSTKNASNTRSTRNGSTSTSTTKSSTRSTTRLSSRSKLLKVPIGKLLSIPEKKLRGGVDVSDDVIDDAEEKAARYRRTRQRPLIRPMVDPSRSILTPSGGFSVGVDALDKKTKIAHLESIIRLKVKQLHSVSKSGKKLLKDAFTAVDMFGVGVLSTSQFSQAVTDVTGIQISDEDAKYLCRRSDPAGDGDTVEVAKFITRILSGASRVDNTTTHNGYPVRDDEFVSGKINYPRSRSLVQAPSDFDLNSIDASLFPPDANLNLQFVHGYDFNTCPSQNLFVTSDTNVLVYATASLAVVHDTKKNRQAHFTGHTDCVTCATMCDAAIEFQGVTYPKRTLVATGQKTPSKDSSDKENETSDGTSVDNSDGPFVSVWDARTRVEIARVYLAPDARAVAAVAFSNDGANLVTVASDGSHTTQVWDWRVQDVGEIIVSGSQKTLGDSQKTKRKKRKVVGLLHENIGFKERPGGVFGVKYDPFIDAGLTHTERFVTWGKKHVKLWTRVLNSSDTNRHEWISRPMEFGSFGVMDITSVVFLPPSETSKKQSSLVTGHPDGSLLIWRDGKAVHRVTNAHGTSTKRIQSDGSVSFGSGVRALHLRRNTSGNSENSSGYTLLSGAADGVIKQWKVVEDKSSGLFDPLTCITDPIVLLEAEESKQMVGSPIGKQSREFKPNAIRSFDVNPDSDTVFVGTERGEVWEVCVHPELESVKVVTRGHAGNVTCASWHPHDTHTLYTASDSGEIHCVDTFSTNEVEKIITVEGSKNYVTIDEDATYNKFLKKINVPFPVTAIAVGGDDVHVAVGGSNGEVLVICEDNFETVTSNHSNKSKVEDMKFSPDGGSRLAVTYKDGRVFVFGRNEGVSTSIGATNGTPYSLVHRFRGHAAAATKHVDWSGDGKIIATCGADHETLYWDVFGELGDQLVSIKPQLGTQNLLNQRDTRWATYTRPLGFPVMGVWGSAGDIAGEARNALSSINALDVSVDGRYCVSGDDSGLVKLFNYPALTENSAHKAYVGHAGAVIAAWFNKDGTQVVSVGGRDRSAFVFNVEQEKFVEPPQPTPEKKWLPLDASGKNFGYRVPRGEEGLLSAEQSEEYPSEIPNTQESEEVSDDIVEKDEYAEASVFVPRKEIFKASTSFGDDDDGKEMKTPSLYHEISIGKSVKSIADSIENDDSIEDLTEDDRIDDHIEDDVRPLVSTVTPAKAAPKSGRFKSAVGKMFAVASLKKAGADATQRKTFVSSLVSNAVTNVTTENLNASADQIEDQVEDQVEDPPFVASPKVPVADSESEPEIEEDVGDGTGYSSEEFT